MSLTSAPSRLAFSAVICDLDGTLLDRPEDLLALLSDNSPESG